VGTGYVRLRGLKLVPELRWPLARPVQGGRRWNPAQAAGSLRLAGCGMACAGKIAGANAIPFVVADLEGAIVNQLFCILLLLANAMVLLGQVWPSGAPPFAHTFTIATLATNLVVFGVPILRARKKKG